MGHKRSDLKPDIVDNVDEKQPLWVRIVETKARTLFMLRNFRRVLQLLFSLYCSCGLGAFTIWVL